METGTCDLNMSRARWATIVLGGRVHESGGDCTNYERRFGLGKTLARLWIG